MVIIIAKMVDIVHFLVSRAALMIIISKRSFENKRIGEEKEEEEEEKGKGGYHHGKRKDQWPEGRCEEKREM
jgi:uncharacterized membrane-anchored protein YitT (DUF2179 family)